jgi:hypothetical protein
MVVRKPVRKLVGPRRELEIVIPNVNLPSTGRTDVYDPFRKIVACPVRQGHHPTHCNKKGAENIHYSTPACVFRAQPLFSTLAVDMPQAAGTHARYTEADSHVLERV